MTALSLPAQTLGRPANPGEPIGSHSVLPADRSPVTLVTADGLALEGQLDLPPAGRAPVASLLCLHPLPTDGGSLDSHILRKMSWRLPALADIAVFRFNTRGTGASEGRFDDGERERLDVEAAISFCVGARLPKLWLFGWSFGSEIALKYGADDDRIAGAFLLSPVLARAGDADLARWARSGKPLVAMVAGKDIFLPPPLARPRFGAVPQAELIVVDDAKHLWVGEKYVSRVLTEVVGRLNPPALPLPSHWYESMEGPGR